MSSTAPASHPKKQDGGCHNAQTGSFETAIQSTMGDVTVGLISYRCRVRCDKGNNSLAHNCVFNRQQWKDHGKEEYNIKGLDSCLRDEFIVAL